MSILDLLNNSILNDLAVSAPKNEPTIALDLCDDTVSNESSIIEPITALDLFNKPTSTEHNNTVPPTTSIKLIGIDGPKSKILSVQPNAIVADIPKRTIVETKLNTPIKINVVKPTNQDKHTMEQQTPVKVLRIRTPVPEPKIVVASQVNKVIKINIINTTDAKVNSVKTYDKVINSVKVDDKKHDETQRRINHLELENKLLSKKLADITTAYLNVCQHNKNLSFVLSMRR